MSKKYLTRSEAAEYLTEQGLPTSKNTLGKFVSIGGGPAYRIYGNRAVYTTKDLDAWANERLSCPSVSASTACR